MGKGRTFDLLAFTSAVGRLLLSRSRSRWGRCRFRGESLLLLASLLEGRLVSIGNEAEDVRRNGEVVISENALVG